MSNLQKLYFPRKQISFHQINFHHFRTNFFWTVPYWGWRSLSDKEPSLFKGPSGHFLASINTKLFQFRKIRFSHTQIFCSAFLLSLITITCRYMFISDFLFQKCKRRTLDVDADSRCYWCPHTNVTSVAVLFFPSLPSCTYCKYVRLVCESRREICVRTWMVM